MEIPENKTIDTTIEKAVKYICDQLKKNNTASVSWYRECNHIGADLNKAQAIEICKQFKAKGYYHEIRMHSNNGGKVFFYCVNISKTPIRTNDTRMAWSVYVG